MSNIYRIVLSDSYWQDDGDLDILYAIGCSKSYTGFWTPHLSCAARIYNYIQQMYFLDFYSDEPYPLMLLKTTIENVQLTADYALLKTYDNDFFDLDELFVSSLNDISKVQRVYAPNIDF